MIYPEFFFIRGKIVSGASLVVAINAVRKGAAAEGMKVRDYVWRGHDPTAVAVMTEVISCIFCFLIIRVLSKVQKLKFTYQIF